MTGARFFSYLRAQLKRAMSLLPPVLAAGALLLAATSLFFFAAGRDHEGDASAKKLKVGVAGDVESGQMLRLAIYALENFDATRYSLELVKADEAECAQRMRTGELNAYIVVPDGFEEAMYRGETRPIRYVSTEGATLVGAVLIDEVVKAISDLMLETENAVYGAQRYLAENVPDVNFYGAGDRLSQEYLSMILARDELFETELVGVGAGLDFSSYYLCAVTLLFLLLWGVAASPLFARSGGGPRRMLCARGFGAARQTIAEYISYMALLLIGLACIAAVAGGLLYLLPDVWKSLGVDAETLRDYLIRAVAVAFVFGAMQLLLSELAAGVLGGMLLQFLVAGGMAYVCGCFYPSSFFPAAMQRVGGVLPAGLGFRWLSAPDLTGGLCLAGYLAAFLLLLVWRRSRRLKGGAA